MTNEEQEVIDSQNDTEETVTDNEEELEIDLDEEVEEDVDALKKELATLKAQKAHWKKKANTPKEDSPKSEKNESKNSDISTTDMYSLIKADVAPEDIAIVQKFARTEGVSIQEALKDSVLKSILDKQVETRKTSQATSTSATRKSVGQVSEETLYETARTGKMPESDADFKRLAEARLNRFNK